MIVDNCLIGRKYLDRAKALAAERTRLRADRILVAATHTHTAPPGKDRRTNRDDAAHRAYFKQLVEGIAEAIAQAEKNLSPPRWRTAWRSCPRRFSTAAGTHEAWRHCSEPFGSPNDIVRMNLPRNLIDRPAGPTDPEVHFIPTEHGGWPTDCLAGQLLAALRRRPAAGGMSADYFAVAGPSESPR